MTAPLSRAMHGPRAQLGSGRRATPARLRFAAVSIAVLALLTGVVGLLAATQRQSATVAAWRDAEPLMVTAQAVDTSLSDADTTAAASFLQGRVEPAALQSRYQADLTSASTGVAEAARQAGSDPAVAQSLETLSTDLPLYAGIVQEADFNERQSFYPLAAAYLAEANNLMRSSILPAAAQVYATEVDRLASDQTTAVSAWLVALAAVFLVALLVALVVAQRRLSRHFRRSWNVALAVGTAVMLVLGIWAVVALVTQGTGVADAQANGSHPVSVFTDARILALRARRGRRAHPPDPGLRPVVPERLQITRRLRSARSSPRQAPAGSFEQMQLAKADAAFHSYQALHRQIRADDASLGDLSDAVILASGDGANSFRLCRPG